MSSLETATRPRAAPPAARRAQLSGWGRTRRSSALLYAPHSEEQVAELLAQAPAAGMIARGAGRSYGDPAQNADGAVVEMTALDRIDAPDASRGEVRVQAGATLGRVLEALARDSLTLPVVPGTSHVTVGGAIAADVHGKNHPSAGSFGRHVSALELLTPAGERLLVSTDSEPELFAATLGGMGLTGLICAATLRAVPLRAPYALADVERVATLEDALGLIAEAPHSHAIAWLDLLAARRGFARAVVTRSREGDGVPERALRVGAGPHPGVPERFPGGLLRPALVRAFNEAQWQRAARPLRERPISVDAQLFPLDRIERWNNLYGPDGLVQYQFAVPAGRERTLRSVLEALRAERLPMYLATVKRLGAASTGQLSFPLPGWTLAIDFPAGAAGLAAALDRADELVVSVGGRVYLAKDARMRSEMLAAMYPQLDRFAAARSRVDPHGLLRSDLARRLGMVA